MLSRWHSSAVAVVALGLALSGCGSEPPEAAPPPEPAIVKASALDDLLLNDSEIDSVMGTAMTSLMPVVEMSDNRNLLPNLNCLGVWQVNEAAIYGDRGAGNWQSMRQQTMREPDSDQWKSIAVQSVVLFETADAARHFFTQSAARWAECTDHRVNITLNDTPLPKWLSGKLDATDSRLTIPITRGTGDQIQSCQHVLAVSENVIIDVQACKSQSSPVTQAADIVSEIEATIPTVATKPGG